MQQNSRITENSLDQLLSEQQYEEKTRRKTWKLYKSDTSFININAESIDSYDCVKIYRVFYIFISLSFVGHTCVMNVLILSNF